MGKCNLFAPVSQPTGNFLLFSQYSEDLTKSTYSEDYYRVVPSKYVLVKLNQKPGWDSVAYSEWFQNYYENACSILRSNSSVNWTPDCASDMLWKSLVKSGLVNTPVEDPEDGTYTSSSVLRIGDINITSDKEVDGIHYTETYIEVPQDAARQKFDFVKFGQELSRIVQYPNNYIDGYPSEDYPTAGSEPWPSNLIDPEDSDNPKYADGSVVVDDHKEYIYKFRTQSDFRFVQDPVKTYTGDDSYTFDCVLVLYDIVKRGVEEPDYKTVWSGIPMGIYFTGSPDSSGTIQNPVTIWLSNPDIYQQGTSYGFRICTRYLSTQNSLYIVDSTIEDTEELYNQYAAVMAKIGQSQVTMDQIVQQMSVYQNNITNHLANIKNYKVNVPYLRNIGGKWYWFVNGKNLGVAAHETSLVWESY